MTSQIWTMSEKPSVYAWHVVFALVFFVTLFGEVSILLVDNDALFFVLIAITSLLSAFYIGPPHAAIQSMVDPRRPD